MYETENDVMKRMCVYSTDPKVRPGRRETPDPMNRLQVLVGSGREDPDVWAGAALVVMIPCMKRPIVVPVMVADMGDDTTCEDTASQIGAAAVAMIQQNYTAAVVKLHTDTANEPVSCVAVCSVFEPDGSFVTPTYYALGMKEDLVLLYTGTNPEEAHKSAREFFDKIS